MNRFRTKKKAKEASEALGRPSNDSDVPPPLPTLKSSKTFRLGGRKHQEPEPKLELDLAHALPSSDEFRTSLLMSGLSARFSMLREQDDPNSKIGKASDDSVLFSSKRQSRLNDFGFSSVGLSDIAEVSSINGSIRPPFAKSRTDSIGYGTDDDSVHSGSIMNRAKVGEGNNLFGGRQKVYKIKTSGSTKNLADGSDGGRMGGRALYESDVSQSAFQKLREHEKEEQREKEQHYLEHEREEAVRNSQDTRSASPPLAGYNRNRETSSTTSSAGPSITRSSTAATSFTSQRTPSLSGSHTPVTPGAPTSMQGGTERTTTKVRRLYETGLDQHLNEQQSSAMNRIDTITRQRTFGSHTPPPGIASPTSSTHTSDRWDRQQIIGKVSMPNMRTTSPSPTFATRGNFDFGIRPNIITERVQAFGAAAPISPPISGDDDHTVLAVQPNDVGKATALGAFSKPVQPYDESKYSQRQLQLQLGREGREGRETPPPRRNSPPRAFVPRQRPVGRPRGDSSATFASASARSRSSSSAQRQFLPHERVQEKSVPQIAEPDKDSSNHGMSSLGSRNNSSVGSPVNASNNSELEHEYQQPLKPVDLYNKYMQEQPSIECPPESEHPALRAKPFDLPDSNNDDVSPISTAMPQLQVDQSPASSVHKESPSDSPTLGPTTGLGSLIHQHMRTDSNTSSVYGGSTYGGMPSSGFVSRFPGEPTEPLPQHQYGNKANPWEHNDWDTQSEDGDKLNNFSLESAIPRQQTDSVVPLPLNPKSPNVRAGNGAPKTSWEKELEAHHTRNGSSETQKEQQDFKMDLAARRKKVQENLKSFVETESKSESPTLGSSEWSKDGQPRANPLDLLKNKTSRGSIVVKAEKAGQSKAMKMLGIGHSTISSSPSPGKPGFDDGLWKQEEADMLRGTKSHILPAIIPTAPIVAPQTKAFRQARRDAQRDREKQVAMRHQQRLALEGADQDWAKINFADQEKQRGPMRDNAPPNIRVRQRSPSHERHPPPRVAQNRYRNGSSQERSSQEEVRPGHSSRRPSRERSNSDASGRSKPRSDRYKDELAKSMAEGTSSSTRAFPEGLNPPPTHFLPRSPKSPGLPFSPSPIPSPMNGSMVASRNAGNSKKISGYFDGHKLQPLQTGDGIDIGLSPRPSPITPFSANTTPSLMQPPQTVTPTTQGSSSDSRPPGARKRSVNKSDISEPRFISSTSRVTTVDLAPGVSLQSGSSGPPPIPAVNPRRKTRAMFGFGKKEDFDDYTLPAATQSTEEMSTFSADEDTKPKSRGKLRKISSEGGNLNVRARQAANATPSPAVPAFPSNAGIPPVSQLPGGMF